MPALFVALALALGVAAPAAADPLAGLPIKDLQPGEWRLDRHIDKGDGNPRLRSKTYCTSPERDLGQLLRGAALLCSAASEQTGEREYTFNATCRLPGISGRNTTVITLHSPTHYTALMETEGTKFGEKQHRKERIEAIRLGDCKP